MRIIRPIWNNFDAMVEVYNHDHPYFPNHRLPVVVEALVLESSNPEEFVQKTLDWLKLYFFYGWADPRKGYFIRNSNDVLEEGSGLCAEKAILLVSAARMAGLDAKLGIRKRPYRRPYEHAAAIIQLDSGETITAEPCGCRNVESYEVVYDDRLCAAFAQWREGVFVNL